MILLIQPRDPLIVRDGRPFAAFPGAKVRGYPFPPPQVIAGAVRGRVGYACGYQKGDRDKWRHLLSLVRVEGPLLLDRAAGGVLFPAPLDAVLKRMEDAVLKRMEEEPCPERRKKEGAGYRLYRLGPEPIEEGAGTNLPAGLEPVFAPQSMPKVKSAAMPAFWYAERFLAWLGGKPEAYLELGSPGELGFRGLPTEYRTHVKIEAETQTAEESKLFETSGLEFLYPEEEAAPTGNGLNGQNTRLSGVRDLALLVRVTADLPASCPGSLEAALTGIHPLGGERRLALWEPQAQEALWLAEPPGELLREIERTKRARLVLLTPADFNTGGNERPYLPPGGAFGGARVVAAAVDRPLVVSGWDMLAGQPKPSRRLVPAGSVYFVDLSEVGDVETWVKGRWMSVLPEQPEQSQRDGYGLAVVGVWR